MCALINMPSNVRPWLRYQHDFWPNKPFGLDIAGLDKTRTVAASGATPSVFPRDLVSFHFSVLLFFMAI